MVANHPQLGLRHGEDLTGDLRPDTVHRLDRGAQRVAVFVGVVGADAAARFHCIAGHASDADAVADDVRGVCECRIDRRRIASLMGVRFVAGIVAPDRRGVRRQGIVHGNHRRKGLVVDLDRLRRILRLIDRQGDDEGDRLAGKPHPPLRQQRLRTNEARRTVTALAGIGRFEHAQSAPGQIVAGQHREYAGCPARRRHIDPADLRMGVGRAQNIGTRLARLIHVVREPSPAGQQPQILFPLNGLADADHVH